MKTTKQILRQVVRESIAAAPTPLQLAAAALKLDADMGRVDPGSVTDVAYWLTRKPEHMPFPDEDEFANAGAVIEAMGIDPYALDSY